MSIKKILRIGQSTTVQNLGKIIHSHQKNLIIEEKKDFEEVKESDNYDLILIENNGNQIEYDNLILDCPVLFLTDHIHTQFFLENNTIIHCHCTMGLNIENAIFVLYTSSDLNDEFMDTLDELLAGAGSTIWVDDEIQFDGVVRCINAYFSIELNLANLISETLESYGFTNQESDDITKVAHMTLDAILEQSETPIHEMKTNQSAILQNSLSTDLQTILKEKVLSNHTKTLH